jgi:hypothetical protein
MPNQKAIGTSRLTVALLWVLLAFMAIRIWFPWIVNHIVPRDPSRLVAAWHKGEIDLADFFPSLAEWALPAAQRSFSDEEGNTYGQYVYAQHGRVVVVIVREVRAGASLKEPVLFACYWSNWFSGEEVLAIDKQGFGHFCEARISQVSDKTAHAEGGSSHDD